MRKVLVTGGAGFLGSHLAESLLERGDEVVVLDNFDPFYDPAIKRRNLRAIAGRARLVEGDLRDGTALGALFERERLDAVLHLAALAGVRPSIRDPARYADVNVVGTSRLLEAIARRPVPLVFASSSSVYGACDAIPFREEDPCGTPASPYAATKRAGELSAYAAHRLHGIPVACLRYFTVYGPRQRPEMAIHKFTRHLERGEPIPVYGDGESARDYTFVDDAVAGTLAALDRCEGFEIYNLGGSKPVRLLDLVERLGEAVGRAPAVERRPAEPGDVPTTCAEVTKASSRLGWKAAIPLEEGLARFVAWYRRERAEGGVP